MSASRKLSTIEDLLYETSAEESSSVSEVTDEAGVFDGYIPADIWVLFSLQSPECFALISRLSRYHYQAVNSAWLSKVKNDLTDYPQLQINENYRGYYQRITKKLKKAFLRSGEMALERIDDYSRLEILKDSVIYNLEKLASNLLKIIPKDYLQSNFPHKYKDLFAEIGSRSKKNTATLRLLLDLIKDFPKEAHAKVLVAGLKSFMQASRRLRGNKPVLHEAEVYTVLNEAWALYQVNDVLPEELSERVRHLWQNIHVELKLSGVLTSIQPVGITVEDLIFIYNFLVRLAEVHNLSVNQANTISVLLKTMDNDKQRTLVTSVLNTAVAMCFDITSFTKSSASFPAGCTQMLDLAIEEYGLEKVESDFLRYEYLSEMFAKSLYTYMAVFNVKEVEDAIAYLSSLSLPEDSAGYIDKCLTLAVAGNLELEKTKLLLEKVPESNRVQVAAFLLRNVETGVVSDIVKLEPLIDWLDSLGILQPVIKHFIQINLKEIPDKFARKFPHIPWRQILKEIVEEKLIAKANDNQLSDMLNKHSDLFWEVLVTVFTDIAIARDDNKAKYLFESVPEHFGFVISPVLEYLHKCTEDPEYVKSAFVNFYDAYVNSGRDTHEVIARLAIYDVKHKASLLNNYIDYCAPDIMKCVEALKLTANTNEQAFIFNQFDEKTQITIFVYAFNDCINQQYLSTESLTKHYSKLSALFNGLSRVMQNEILFQFIEKTANDRGTTVLHAANFCLKVIGISKSRYVRVASEILFSCLKSTWKLDPAKTLLAACKPDRCMGGENNIKALLNLILLRALYSAVIKKKSQMIVGLINLPQAWDLLKNKDINEILKSLQDELTEAENEFLIATIVPRPKVVEKLAPPVEALPSQVGIYKQNSARRVVDEYVPIRDAFDALCRAYSDDFYINRNKHDALLVLMVNCLYVLKVDKSSIADPDVFGLHAIKVLLLALITYLEDRHSKNLSSRIDSFVATFPMLLSDRVAMEDKYKNLIETVVNIFKDYKGNNANLIAENIMVKIAGSYEGLVLGNRK